MDRLEKALIFLASILVAVMVVLMTLEVFLRYTFSISIKISEEYSGYLFAAATMLAFYPAMTRGRFLRITAGVSLLPLRVRAAWELAVGVISSLFCLLLAQQTWILFQTSREFGSVSEQYSATPLMYPQLILPAALFLLSFGMLVRAGQLAASLWRGNTALAKEEDKNVLE
ncbi:TRAP transporter small permease [Mesorhizobium sp. LHD-90]|uniref:TRAP transporter small permease n=1 Tax=Mesorhizobium sp. LHD-90 TaxID=3071414 RepID=UPI0027E0C801|nr:TRAP transporter small permease [Mesorhizobium sp. LHD-90]MDQ6436967.1 TRAP transporter small permease [Mesorhizobium sp. LHD-90]